MKITNRLHRIFLKEVVRYKSRDESMNLWVQHYLGTNRRYEGVKSANTRKLAKNIIYEFNPNQQQVADLISSLYQSGTTFTEIDFAGKVLGVVKHIRPQITPQYLDFWLDFATGWAEVDLLCQSNFSALEILAKWSEWKKMLIKFRRSQNISKRRASLVLLVKATRESADPRLSKLAFSNIDILKSETTVLITKAVSWLLRSLIYHHDYEVKNYLETHQSTLPKIAYRETKKKLETGKKS